MNHSAAYVSPRPMGYWAMIRLPMDAKARPIMEWCARDKCDKPKRFDDAYSALRAATDRLESYMNSKMLRDGVTLLSTRSEAEKLFEKAEA